MEPLMQKVRVKWAPVLALSQRVLPVEPSPNSEEDPMLRLYDYERVLLKKLHALGPDEITDPPVFEWSGTAINLVDMLDFARTLINIVEARLKKDYRNMKLSDDIFDEMSRYVESMRQLDRLRESFDEIEDLARQHIRSPRFDVR